MTDTPLSADQVAQFQRDGFLLVSGLIPSEAAAAAESAMWRCLGVSPGDSASWQTVPPGHRSFEEPALVACYTPAYIAAAAQLAGDDPSTFRTPTRAYAINVFPRTGEWQWPRPHIDHAIKDHAHKTFPRAFRIAAMTFLSDVEPHGGGTVVWPGSHRQIEALARSDPQQYEYMWPLGQAIRGLKLAEPVEQTPRRGDVLFYHYLCAHSGSDNVRERPRFALNMKW
jgi:hypothetical protein